MRTKTQLCHCACIPENQRKKRNSFHPIHIEIVHWIRDIVILIYCYSRTIFRLTLDLCVCVFIDDIISWQYHITGACICLRLQLICINCVVSRLCHPLTFTKIWIKKKRVRDMEGNRDEAERCIGIAVQALREAKIEKAEKFLNKAERLYPSQKAKGKCTQRCTWHLFTSTDASCARHKYYLDCTVRCTVSFYL